jgi:hypothetical protein
MAPVAIVLTAAALGMVARRCFNVSNMRMIAAGGLVEIHLGFSLPRRPERRDEAKSENRSQS